jgi:hypothetical protein
VCATSYLHLLLSFVHSECRMKTRNDFILHQNQKRKRSRVLKLYKNVFHIWQEIVTFYVHIAFNSDISFQFKCLLILNILDLWTDKIKLFLSDVHLCTVVRLTQFCSSKKDKLKILSQSFVWLNFVRKTKEGQVKDPQSVHSSSHPSN